MKLFPLLPSVRSCLALTAGIAAGLLIGAGVLAMAFPKALPVISMYGRPPAAAPTGAARRANFGAHRASPEAHYVADWVADSHDAADSDFVIVDKKFATLYLFDSASRLRAASPVLLGAAAGDDSVDGIGSRPIADVRPEERTTPAGRFVAEQGRNATGEDVIWIDYAASVSMHRVRTTNPAEHRLERLASAAIADRRISYGCINVPSAFYDAYLRPLFATRRVVVYVLPEVKPVEQVFASFDAAARRRSDLADGNIPGVAPPPRESALLNIPSAPAQGVPDGRH